MGTVVQRWMALATDGRPVVFELYADHTIHLVMPPEGSSGTIPVDECHEGIYDRHGTLIVSREPHT